MTQMPLFALPLTLHRNACEDALKDYPETFEVIFADPPYFTQKSKSKRAKYSVSERLIKQNWQDFFAEWDDIWESPLAYFKWTLGWMRQAQEALTENGSMFVCGSHHGIWAARLAAYELNMYVIQDIAWCIPNAMPHLAGKQMASSHQTLLWMRKGKRHIYDKEAAKKYNDGKNLRDYWLIPNATHLKESKHPSKKPPALMQRAFDIATNEGALVCDPFGGSGRTYLGAQQVSKVKGVVLIEKEAKYCTEIAQNYFLEEVSDGHYKTMLPPG